MSANSTAPVTRLDIKALKRLEQNFLMQYPSGFETPELAKRIKRHTVGRMTELSREFFAESALANVSLAAANMARIVSRSSLVSVFEKPRFRDFVGGLNEDEKAFLVDGLREMLHGNQRLGFEAMLDLLKTRKLAKWSLLTVIPNYYAPVREIFVKPTTTKGILKHFGITDPVYKPTPTWDFYEKYRTIINAGRERVDKSIGSSNVAFSGFLMMSVEVQQPPRKGG